MQAPLGTTVAWPGTRHEEIDAGGGHRSNQRRATASPVLGEPRLEVGAPAEVVTSVLVGPLEVEQVHGAGLACHSHASGVNRAMNSNSPLSSGTFRG